MTWSAWLVPQSTEPSTHFGSTTLGKPLLHTPLFSVSFPTQLNQMPSAVLLTGHISLLPCSRWESRGHELSLGAILWRLGRTQYLLPWTCRGSQVWWHTHWRYVWDLQWQPLQAGTLGCNLHMHRLHRVIQISLSSDVQSLQSCSR